MTITVIDVNEDPYFVTSWAREGTTSCILEVFSKGVQSKKIQQKMHKLHLNKKLPCVHAQLYNPPPPPLYTTVTGVYLSSYMSYTRPPGKTKPL